MLPNLSHYPVMVNEVVSLLNPKDNYTYLDGTFGQGGYSKLILESSKTRILAIDRDKESEYYAEEVRKKYGSRFLFLKDKLSNLELLLKKTKINSLDGIVLDLGISNTQLNNPQRGFSFTNDGPLDMRMDSENTKLTAEIIINEFEEKELSNIFFYYGEERNSKKIAKSIITYRKKKRIDSTKVLSDIISKINNSRFKHPATRVFQALRIYINEELNELEKILELSLKFLRTKSRIVIVTFHSLEDRIVKNFFKKNSILSSSSVTDKSIVNCNLKIITKKPLTPSKEEVKINPRSKSAKLRVAEKQ